ncbi:MAG: hypothetical protein K0B15_12245 [Lentimicrobium sp.]|nr:hypothetical protein [Lentimicrobium sp.]
MGLTPKGSVNELRRRMAVAKQNIEFATLLRLQKLGEIAVAHAKSVPPEIGFRDQTGNLRSSMGYAVYLNGQIQTKTFSGTAEGVAKGTEVCQAVALNYPTGWLLVVVAGMSYALKVESRGRDVLSSAESLVWSRMPGELEKLKNEVKRMAV